jgi:hypothetical protein
MVRACLLAGCTCAPQAVVSAMGGPRALLAALWALGAAGVAALRIGAFNIQSFADNNALDPSCGSIIAQVSRAGAGLQLGSPGEPASASASQGSTQQAVPPTDPVWLRHHAGAGGARPGPERGTRAHGAN